MRKRQIREIVSILFLWIVAFLCGCNARSSPPPSKSINSPSPGTATPTETTVHHFPKGIIAFIGADGNVWLINADGSNKRRLTKDAKATGLDWSPDGHVLAFTVRIDGRSFELHLYNVSDSIDNVALSGKASEMFWDPEWSPDGRSLALLSWSRINDRLVPVLYSVRDNLKKNLTAIPLTYPTESGLLPPASVRWSPDGKHLLIDTGCCAIRGIDVIDVENGKTVYKGSAFSYAWSQDGTYLAIGKPQVVNPPLPAGNGKSSSLIVRDIEHGGIYTVATGTARAMYLPVEWLSDESLLFEQQPEPPDTISSYWIVSIKNGQVGKPIRAKKIPPRYRRASLLELLPADMRKPDTGCFSWSSDGRWVAFHTGHNPGNIYIFNLKGSTPPTRIAEGGCPLWQP